MGDFSSPPSKTPITTRKLCTPRSPFTVVIILLLSLTAAARISYSDHCNDVVREPPLLPDHNPLITDTWFLALRHTHISCAPNRTNKGICVNPYSLSFWTRKAYKTQKNAVFQIESMLELFGLGDRVQFSLSGLWDSVSGKLCMVGPGFGKFSSNHVVLKLDYLNSSSMFSSLVNGTLEGLDSDNKTNFDLKPLSILGVNLENYKYELIDKVSESNDFQLLDDMSSDSLRVQDLKKTMCVYIQAAQYFELEYKSDCNSVNCDFLGKGNNNLMPSMMYTNEVKCLEDGRVRFLLNFGDNGENDYQSPFKPNTDLISEGKWDAKQKRLNMVGCRISSDWDEGFVRECSFRLSLRFPAKMNLRERSIIVGELWSSSSVNETGYFGRVVLSSKRNNDIRAPSLTYDYTELDKAKIFCANKIIQEGEGKPYPRPLSVYMSFDLVARNKKVMGLSGSAYPLFVGSQQYMHILGWQKQKFSNLLNVSYALSLGCSHDFELSSEHKKIQSFDISAEGTYDSESGHVCMIGCMRVGQNLSFDCEIVVDIQYHPVFFEVDDDVLILRYIEINDGEVVKGTIKSTREKSDGLYFEPFEIASRWI